MSLGFAVVAPPKLNPDEEFVETSFGFEAIVAPKLNPDVELVEISLGFEAAAPPKLNPDVEPVGTSFGFDAVEAPKLNPDVELFGLLTLPPANELPPDPDPKLKLPVFGDNAEPNEKPPGDATFSVGLFTAAPKTFGGLSDLFAEELNEKLVFCPDVEDAPPKALAVVLVVAFGFAPKANGAL